MSITTDPRGLGFWYDRSKRRWIRIHDHLVQVLERPERYRLTDAEVARIRAISGFEAQRDIGIPLVTAHGFIRARLIRDRLGWQFSGDPEGALRILSRFAQRHGLGPAILVRWTDFASRADREDRLHDLLANGGAP